MAQTGIDESNCAKKQGFNLGHLCLRGRETYLLTDLSIPIDGCSSVHEGQWGSCPEVVSLYERLHVLSNCMAWKLHCPLSVNFQGNASSYFFSFTCGMAACDCDERPDSQLKMSNYKWSQDPCGLEEP